MDFDGGIGGQNSEMWEWRGEEYCLQRDLLNDSASCLWGEASQNVGDAWSILDEQTPIKHCTDFNYQFCDIGDIINKDFEEGKESLQAKRRRMLLFSSESNEMESSMTADGLSESLQMNLDFSGGECLLNCDGTDELAEEWLVDCSEDSEAHCTSEEMNNSTTTIEQVDMAGFQNVSPHVQANIVQRNPVQAGPRPLKAGRIVIGAQRKSSTSVAYPFALIKPCGFQGDVTLNDINQRILAPPPFKIKHKKDEEPISYPTSAISGKPVVHKTKIHTEGGKGSITITRTRG